MFEKSSEELALNKLLILYILYKIDIKLSKTQLTQVVLENDIMNYFILQQFISELSDSNFIDIELDEQNELYSLSSKATQTLEYFISRIPISLKNQIDKYIKENKEEVLRETQIKCTYHKIESNEFVVNLKVLENKSVLMNIDLNVPTSKQAKLICENWKNNAPNIYSDIIHLLIQK